MEDLIKEITTQFTKAATVYLGLSGLYMVFCAVAAFTKTQEDDKIADKLKRFFSLPIKK